MFAIQLSSAVGPLARCLCETQTDLIQVAGVIESTYTARYSVWTANGRPAAKMIPSDFGLNNFDFPNWEL